jgi:hypothetical protein
VSGRPSALDALGEGAQRRRIVCIAADLRGRHHGVVGERRRNGILGQEKALRILALLHRLNAAPDKAAEHDDAAVLRAEMRFAKHCSLNVRFAPKATELLRHHEMTRRAKAVMTTTHRAVE